MIFLVRLLDDPKWRELFFTAVIDENSETKIVVESQWKNSGKIAMTNMTMGVLTGAYTDQVVNSIEKYSTKEAKDIVATVEEAFTSMKGMIDVMKTQEDAGNNDGIIPPSQAFTPDIQ